MTQNEAARKRPRAPLRRNGSRSRSRHSLVTPIDWKLAVAAAAAVAAAVGRHSLVTPIDWKRSRCRPPCRKRARCRHSLVTPIDWKLVKMSIRIRAQKRRHSLVTPIDWKHRNTETERS